MTITTTYIPKENEEEDIPKLIQKLALKLGGVCVRDKNAFGEYDQDFKFPNTTKTEQFKNELRDMPYEGELLIED